MGTSSFFDYDKMLRRIPRPQTRKIEIIFRRDLCVGKNTSQAASVEFCRKAAKLCAQQTASFLAEKSKIFRQFQKRRGILWRKITS